MPLRAETHGEDPFHRQAANLAMLQALDAEQRARHATGAAAELVRKIRDFFGLAGDNKGS